MATLWRTLTGRGRGTAALGLVLLGAGLGFRYPVVAVLGALLVALVVAELASVLGPATVTTTREVSPRVVVRHGECRARLHVDGARRRALVRVDAVDLVDGEPVVVDLPDAGSSPEARRTTTTLDYPVPTPRRGLVTVGPVRVRAVGLTGMAARTAGTGSVDHVRVLPRRIPVTTLPAGHRRAVTGGDDSTELGGTDLVGLHEYTIGDDLRRLHWATSARTGTLMVREDAEPSEPHVCVVLDDRAASYPGSGAAEPFEDAVELAAALCRLTLEAGHPLRFQVASRRVSVTVPGSATRHPRPEGQELELLFAEIDTTADALSIDIEHADLDLAVVVTGAGTDLAELSLALGGAPTRVVAAVDPAPVVAVEQYGGLLVVRSTDSTGLAAAWDRVAAR